MNLYSTKGGLLRCTKLRNDEAAAENMSNDKQETIPMGKTVMVLVIPEPKVRKATAKPVRKHKDKTAYSRKAKHKTPEWGSFFTPKVKI